MSDMDYGVSELYKNMYRCKEVYCNRVVLSCFEEKMNSNELRGEQCAQTPVSHVI
jgi:hypothetical protein